MSRDHPKETGFISKQAFDEACRILVQRNLESKQSKLTLEIRGEVRSLGLQAPIFKYHPPVVQSFFSWVESCLAQILIGIPVIDGSSSF